MSERKADISAYKPKANLVYGMEHGSNPRQNALNFQLANDTKQNELNNTHGGGVRQRRTRRRLRNPLVRRLTVGGSQQLVVPSFPQTGPSISPISNTSNSVATNQTKLNAQVNACNDCYATNTCGQTPGCPQQGGSKKRPFAISEKRVKKSPFRTIKTLKKTLSRFRKGLKIGYSQKSSLRSMGLIPRSTGAYKLGNKYK